jgi:hypothetical protein
VTALAELFDGLSNTFQRRAAAGGRAWRRPRYFRFAGRVSRRSNMFATLRSVSKGRNHGFADRDKSRARPFNASTLTTYAGTFEKQRQSDLRHIQPERDGPGRGPRFQSSRAKASSTRPNLSHGC